MIILELLRDGGMHITKLAAVTLVKDNDDMLLEYFMDFILADENIQLLDCRDNDTRVGVFKLTL